jgi:3-oxo-4-pregnene-20-carboxyl-CoA dehydrogenase alpha subunit
VNIDLSDEAVEYGRVARQALEAAGGDDLVQTAEREPDRREDLVAPAFAELGAWDLDPRGSADELEAAAALSRAAGWWGVAYPVAERLCRPDLDVAADGLVVVADAGPAGRLASLPPERRWAAVTLDGRRNLASPGPPVSPSRTSAFVAELVLSPLGDDDDGAGAGDVALGLVLPCWTLLGMLDRAIDVTRSYVLERQQFGQPLASFQGVQFQLTDAEVERSGVEELAKYALWSLATNPDDEAVADALALRLAVIEAADVVFRVAHQLHGAIGFCDETALSWLSRHSQPLRRLPFALSATRDRLTRHLGRRGLTGLFGGSSGCGGAA